MKIRVIAVVTGVFASTDASHPNDCQVDLTASAVDVDSGSHKFAGLAVSVVPITQPMTVNQFNDAVIQGVIDAVEASTVGMANGWSVDRDNVLISGLLQRA